MVPPRGGKERREMHWTLATLSWGKKNDPLSGGKCFS